MSFSHFTRFQNSQPWPELPYERWKDSCQTLHRWMQIVGKVRLSKSPWTNHSWQSVLYLSTRGLTTSVVHDGARTFSIEFDFVAHRLQVMESHGARKQIPLQSESVASFYYRLMNTLDELGVVTRFDPRPNELPDRTPFFEDETHCSYDPDFSQRFWRAMLRTDSVMQEFRSRFLGKVSPVHFFWGSMDLALTRFSGRRAPEHPGGVPHLPDLIAREAYSHEVSSCGFWPGNDAVPYPAFYSYAYPKPEGFETARIEPEQAFFHQTLKEFILPYEVVRRARDPESMLLAFFQSTYEAAADLGGWDRELLEESAYLKALQSKQRGELRRGAA